MKNNLLKQNAEKQNLKRKSGTLLISFLLILGVVVGGIIAFLVTQTNPVKNEFKPAQVSCEVTESFDGITKSNVNVKNTSDIDAYLRVKLVSYRVNMAGKRIGGTAAVPAFTPGNGWVLYNGCYYYTEPVAPGGSPANALIDSITLTGSYNDADGGNQTLEVLAEAIQSAPAKAAGQSWGVVIQPGSVSVYTGD